MQQICETFGVNTVMTSVRDYVVDHLAEENEVSKMILLMLITECMEHEDEIDCNDFAVDLDASTFDETEAEFDMVWTTADASWFDHLLDNIRSFAPNAWLKYVNFDILVPEEFLQQNFFLCLDNQDLYEDTNSFLAKKIMEVAKLRSKQGQGRSASTHRKASSIIKKHPMRIWSYNDAIQVKGIGPKIGEKIEELLQTGTLEILDQKSEVDIAAELFQSIWGVGPATSQIWLDEGYRTLEDLRTALAAGDLEIQRNQELGLRYCDELNTKMGRDQMELIRQKVTEVIASSIEGEWYCEIVGSYRRGGTSSKDVDVLIWPAKGTDYDDQIPYKLAEAMAEAYPMHILSTGDHQFFAIVTFTDIARRLDVFFCPRDQYPAAMLAHTGSQALNVKMRQDAIDRGWLLNEKYLLDENGEPIPVESEEEIFGMLGLEYLEPHQRSL